jgi:hypothetical protein
MGITVDELVVKLALDATGFDDSSKKAVESIASIEAASRKTQVSIDGEQKKTEKAQEQRRRQHDKDSKQQYKEDDQRKKEAAKQEKDRIREQAKADTKAKKENEERAKAALDAVAKLRNEALSLMTLFTAGKGVKEFFTFAASSGLALTQMSRNMNMAASEVDRWGKVMEKAGGDGKAFQNTLNSLSDQVKDVSLTGQKSDQLISLEALLGRVGKQLVFNKDGTVDWAKNIPLIAQAAKQTKIDESLGKARAGTADRLLDRIGFDVGAKQQLEQGSAALMAQYNATKGLTEEQIKQRTESELQIRALKQDLGVSADKLLQDAYPSIKKILDALDDLAKWLQQHQGVFDSLAGAAAVLATFMAGGFALKMLSPFASIAKAVLGLTGQFGLLKTAATEASTAAGAAQTAGKAGMGLLGKAGAVGAAGAVGYGVGTVINDNFVEGTSFGDAIGNGLTRTMAALGNKTAQETLALDAKHKWEAEHPQEVQRRAHEQLQQMRQRQANAAVSSRPVAPGASDAIASAPETTPGIPRTEPHSVQFDDQRLKQIWEILIQNLRTALTRINEAVFTGARFVDADVFDNNLPPVNAVTPPPVKPQVGLTDQRLADRFVRNIRIMAARINEAVFVGARFVDSNLWDGEVMGASIVGSDYRPTAWDQKTSPALTSAPGTSVEISAPVGSKAGAENAQYAMGVLMTKGWTREQAAGIAANFRKESNFNPNAIGDHGAAYGIGQWHTDRQAQFKRVFGKDIRGSTLQEQLVFAHYELTQGTERAAGDLLRQARTAAQAGALLSRYYERPANGYIEAIQRGAIAQQLAGMPRIGAQMAMNARGLTSNTTTNHNASEVNINGPINIQTAAKDANGIVRDMHAAIRNNSLVNQANTGLA